jgi:ABC-type Na+ transport system ATPase subunit NatA
MGAVLHLRCHVLLKSGLCQSAPPIFTQTLQGLDPASRRVLWDVIKAAKPGRSIILTTHNMEEAEVLCDRCEGCGSV